MKPDGENNGFWGRLLPKGVKMNNCKVDWDKWVDEDEEDGSAEPEFGADLDFNSLFQGGGPPLDEFIDDEDDDLGGEDGGLGGQDDGGGQEVDSDLPELEVRDRGLRA
eukprot:scaffold323_cov414-Prasinococcus_capsulatus_cf.AAC.57